MDKAFTIVMKDKSCYFSYEQIDRMLAQAPNRKVWLLVYLLSRTGRRVSEVLELKPRDVDFDKDMILWNILKKKMKGLKVWMASDHETIETLMAHINKWHLEQDGYVFGSNRVNSKGVYVRYTRKWAFENIRKLTSTCLIKYVGQKEPIKMLRRGKEVILKPDWHPHHFRHSFSIYYLQNNKEPSSLSMLQQQLGHSSINITSDYLQFSQDDRKKALNYIFKKKEEIKDE